MKATTRHVFILSALVSLFLFVGAGIFQVLESQGQEHRFDDDTVIAKLEKLWTNLSVNFSKVEFDSLVRKIQESYHKNRDARNSQHNITPNI